MWPTILAVKARKWLKHTQKHHSYDGRYSVCGGGGTGQQCIIITIFMENISKEWNEWKKLKGREERKTRERKRARIQYDCGRNMRKKSNGNDTRERIERMMMMLCVCVIVSVPLPVNLCFVTSFIGFASFNLLCIYSKIRIVDWFQNEKCLPRDIVKREIFESPI